MVDPFIITVILLTLLYYVSRSTLTHISSLLFYVFRSAKAAYLLLAFFFLPGTIVHEMAHAVVAMCLFLNVREIAIFPKIEKNKIVLGYVMYEKTDPIRSFLTGIAPFFIGLALLVLIPYVTSGSTFAMQVVWLYVIFTITTMMFFSDSDIEQGYVVLPIFIVAVVVLFYVFNFRIDPEWSRKLYEGLNYVARGINNYLFFSLILHTAFIILIRTVRRSH